MGSADDNLFLSDGGSLTTRTANFFERKSIQRSYNFMVYFDESGLDTGLAETDRTGVFSDMDAFHAISVELPNYAFDRGEMNYGPFFKKFPVLDHNGFEFTIKFEEDDEGRVKNMIHKLVRRNIRSDGYLKPYSETVIPNIVVSTYRPDGKNVNKTYFKNCFYMKSSTPSFSYEDGKQIFYDVTFNADHYIFVEQQGAVNQTGR